MNITWTTIGVPRTTRTYTCEAKESAIAIQARKRQSTATTIKACAIHQTLSGTQANMPPPSQWATRTMAYRTISARTDSPVERHETGTRTYVVTTPVRKPIRVPPSKTHREIRIALKAPTNRSDKVAQPPDQAKH